MLKLAFKILGFCLGPTFIKTPGMWFVAQRKKYAVFKVHNYQAGEET